MTGIFILARLGSKRLPSKHLLLSAGRPFIEWLILRIQKGFEGKAVKIIICSADEPVNRRFEQIADQNIAVFYGSIGNIPFRLYQCAVEQEVDNIIMVDGDDILVSIEGLLEVYDKLQQGEVLVKTQGLPFGMNSSGIKITELSAVAEKIKDMEILETGWGRYFDENKYFVTNFEEPVNNENFRFTLDYEEDRFFFDDIITHFGEGIIEARDEKIIRYVRDNKVSRHNAAIHEKYWQNFYAEMKKENNG